MEELEVHLLFYRFCLAGRKDEALKAESSGYSNSQTRLCQLTRGPAWFVLEPKNVSFLQVFYFPLEAPA